jgi:hypothetical protein
MPTEGERKLVELLEYNGLMGRAMAIKVAARLIARSVIVREALDLPDPEAWSELVLDRNNLHQALMLVLMETGPVVVPEAAIVEAGKNGLTLHQAIKVVGHG